MNDRVADYRFVKPSPPEIKGPLARAETAVPTPRRVYRTAATWGCCCG